MQLDKINAKLNESDFYKMQEGDNRMRILTDFVETNTITKAGGTFGGHVTPNNQPVMNADKEKSDRVRTQGWAWAIIRRADGDEFKIVQFSGAILSQLVAYRHTSEYAFSTMPMPYDINIKTVNAGKKTVEYTVQPARQNTAVTEAEMATLNKKKTIESIVASIISKQEGGATNATAVAGDKEFDNMGSKPEYPENNLGEAAF